VTGWLALLAFADFADLSWPGPISLKELNRALLVRRGVPSFLLDDTTYPDGTTPIMLGGNADVDGGAVILPRRTTPQSWLDRLNRLFGYRLFDCPDGTVRLKRVSGLPSDSALRTYEEGVNAYRFERRTDLAPMVTYWEVRGARYTAADGTQVAIRSIPAAVPYSAELDPPGYRRDEASAQELVTQALADAVRNVLEIDRGAPHQVETWEFDGAPDLQPGDVVQVESDTLGSSGLRWLTGIDQDVTERGGYLAQMEGWAGNGEALAAGADCAEQTLIGSTGVHLGDETIAWYRTPSPSGSTHTVAFTVGSDYTSLSVAGFAHGCNSTVSKVEVWQGGERKGSSDLPVLDENFAQQLDYDQDQYWTAISLPVPGSLVAGAAELRVIAGSNAAASSAPIDDFEVRDLVLRTCGVGQPELPGEA
jgi:hypothetical protein